MIVDIIDLNSPHVAKVLFRSANQARSFKKPLEIIRTDMFRIEEALFRSQGKRGGGSWKRLKPDTIRKKGNSKIIYTEGSNSFYSAYGNNTLVKSLTQKDAPFHSSHIGNHVLSFGTDRPWAESHQYGAPGASIPRRELIRFTPRDQERWIGWLNEYVMQPYRRGSARQ
jgi:phage gpG-like protein